MKIETDRIIMKRVVKCLYCGVGNAINFAEYSTGDCTSKRQMGVEIQHCFELSIKITNAQLAGMLSAFKYISMISYQSI